MHINLNKLEACGFHVDLVERKGQVVGVDIEPKERIHLDFRSMHDQFDALNLSGRDIESALDELTYALNWAQIVKAIKD